MTLDGFPLLSKDTHFSKLSHSVSGSGTFLRNKDQRLQKEGEERSESEYNGLECYNNGFENNRLEFHSSRSESESNGLECCNKEQEINRGTFVSVNELLLGNISSSDQIRNFDHSGRHYSILAIIGVPVKSP